MTRWTDWFKTIAKTQPNDEFERARDLLAALDRGGLPLIPARVNEIARDLGLEVSRKAPQTETIERIRAAVARQASQ